MKSKEKTRISSLFCEDTNNSKLCARRVLGAIGFLSCIAAMFAGVSHDILQPVLLASASLIGLTTIDKIKSAPSR